MIDLRRILGREPVREKDGVLDFLREPGDYCDSFGDQWNRYRTVQSDHHSGTTESRTRFHAETGWRPQDLEGKVLLDVGCGAGRFAEVALEVGAYVVAVDMSTAVYACRANLARFPEARFLVLRADLFDLPLARGSFDGVFSLGVLQHTPSPLAGLTSLVPLLRPGGRLAVWIYEDRGFLRWAQPRTWIRTLIRRLRPRAKLRAAKVLTFSFFPLGWLLSWCGRSGERLSLLLPYAARHHLRRGSLARQWEYCVQDTYDWYGPLYESPQREGAVCAAMAGAGLVNVRRLPTRGMAIVGDLPVAGRAG